MTGSLPEEALGRLRRAIDALPRQIAIAREQAAWTVTRAVTGTAYHGHVVVTATADGQIQAVRISPAVLPGISSQTLAVYVVAAVNEALDRADELVGQDDQGQPADTDVAMVAYESRMDDLMDRLDAVDQALRRLDE